MQGQFQEGANGANISPHPVFKLAPQFCLALKDKISRSKLILTKILKIIATRCQILRLKCSKFDFSWGSTPDPSAPQNP